MKLFSLIFICRLSKRKYKKKKTDKIYLKYKSFK
jgi:hypothetical protein